MMEAVPISQSIALASMEHIDVVMENADLNAR